MSTKDSDCSFIPSSNKTRDVSSSSKLETTQFENLMYKFLLLAVREMVLSGRRGGLVEYVDV